ncbi:protein fem-1 homolog A [Daphnia magna]|uniref:protein fem-1 homolog A n=1 Tax=Daphnia magna TaxID=35525 RepID=UPI001E1BA9AA|nr:protein fem-1 homolog A [Daphnia magna]
MSSNVDNLILEAARRGSIAELNEIRKSYNWIAIPVNFIVKCYSEEGNTPLQVGVANGHYNVVEFLIGELKYQVYPQWKKSINGACSFSWASLDFNKPLPSFKPLSLEMEIIRDVSHQVPIAKLIEYLIDPVNDEPFQWFEFLLNSFVASSISQLEKIVSLELMGTAFIFKHKHYVWRGLQCWEQAMSLRKSTGNLTIPNVHYVLSGIARNAFKDNFPLITSELSLQIFKGNWQRHYRHVDVQVQGLLVSERIFSEINSGQTNPNSFHLENLMRYGHFCCYEENEYNRAFNISLLILEQLSGFQSTSSPQCIRIFVRALDLMLECLEQQPTSKGKGELSFADYLIVIKFGLTILNKLALLSPDTRTTIDYWQLNVMEKVYHLLLDHILSRNQLEIQQLKDCLANYFSMNNAHSFTSLLHLAIKKIDVIQRYPSKIVSVIQLFLETGADPTATDSNGKAPFHILAENYEWFRNDLKSYEAVFQALLDAGGQLNQETPDGKTFMTILKEQKSRYLSSNHPIMEQAINTVLPLSYICAQVIRRAQIPYEHQLPSSMQSLIGRHSAFKVVSSLGDALLS